FQPLLLLWKGIGAYVARNPRYRILFGPVSISNSYTSASRSLIVQFVREHYRESTFNGGVTPKRPFRAQPEARNFPMSTLDQLSEAVADIEPDGKGVPVLLRQYLNLGGRVLDFHLDRDFADVVDGLIVVDLMRTEVRLRERYLGKAGAEEFLRFQSK